MKICMTVNSSPWSGFKGGGQIAVHYLASALARKGHDVHVVYSLERGERPAPKVDYKIHWVRHFNVATLNCNIFSFGAELLRLLRSERFDIVHGNAEEAFFLPWLCQWWKIKFFFTSHAPFIPATGICGGLSRPVFLLKRLNSYLLRAAANGAESIITFSQFSRGLALAGLGRSAECRVHVVSPGIDPSWLEVKRQDSESKDMVFWGRMEDEKGIPELLDAFKTVAGKHPDARLHLIGEGNRTNAYRQMADAAGIGNKVAFHGWMNMQSIQQLAARCGMGIFPSRIESFGLAVAESLAAGLPTVCTDAGALPEIVEDGVTGSVVPTGNAGKLAEAIIEILDNGPKFRRMADNGRNAVRLRFSWDATADKILQLYAQ